jgi:hypothetical protein
MVTLNFKKCDIKGLSKEKIALESKLHKKERVSQLLEMINFVLQETAKIVRLTQKERHLP